MITRRDDHYSISFHYRLKLHSVSFNVYLLKLLFSNELELRTLMVCNQKDPDIILWLEFYFQKSWFHFRPIQLTTYWMKQLFVRKLHRNCVLLILFFSLLADRFRKTIFQRFKTKLNLMPPEEHVSHVTRQWIIFLKSIYLIFGKLENRSLLRLYPKKISKLISKL